MKKIISALLAALASLTMVVAPLAEARDGGHRGGGRSGGGHAQRGGGHQNFNRGNHGAPSRSQMQLNQGARDRVNVGHQNARPGGHPGNRPQGQRPGRGGDRNTNVNVNVNNRHDGGRHDRYDDHHHHHHGGWDDDDDWDHPFATAAAVTAGVAVTSAVIGSIVNSVPPSCVPVNYNGFTYQRCGNTWYQPQYNGPNVQYIVINPPY
ncbi:hypothetical protein [Ottowia sp.]|uniref:hypothetical protein n=1 Tax=Ottowia sp. TaxID=1898956 RepID=UPI003A87CF6A